MLIFFMPNGTITLLARQGASGAIQVAGSSFSWTKC
jgi:hypothetical protein